MGKSAIGKNKATMNMTERKTDVRIRKSFIIKNRAGIFVREGKHVKG